VKLVNLAGRIGVLDDGHVAELDSPYRSVADVLADGSLDRVTRFDVRREIPLAEAPVRTLGFGVSVWGIGLNYRSKLVATGRTPPAHPVLFMKAPSAFAERHDVTLPDASNQVDFEGEIAVVIGTHLFESTVAEAARGIAGVAAANDVTARDVMRVTGSPSLAKSFPGFGQIGAVMQPCTEPGALDAIPIETHVNGDVRQRDDSSGMLLPIADVISLLSRYVLLRPGDVVLSGTPAGTGDETGSFLGPGDVVAVIVDALPPLSTTFR
jgi:2-keto-4-pentenoate hydratase/2-oxohepta-3-ene-1,7-dioic acid hydratase in catechol pathway